VKRAFFKLTDEDLARLTALQPFAEKVMDAMVEEFYVLLLGHPETHKFFVDEATIRRVKHTQRRYFLGLFSGRCDAAYIEDRLRVGAAHERIGLSPRWYLGAYRQCLHLTLEALHRELSDEAAVRDAYSSIQRIVFFDMSLAIDTYIAANLEALGRHQAAIRELSTPVIRVYDRVLLLPLVGAIDSHRAHQVMESVLLHIVEAQAKCMIIDIAGVPVVDTRVAAEYAEAHIKGAISVPYKEKSAKDAGFDATQDSFDLTKLPADKNAPVVFYCNAGECWKSYKASVQAIKAGHKKVNWFRGGIPEWKSKGLPTE
jgi:rsbT co-antagonist protein RsbR